MLINTDDVPDHGLVYNKETGKLYRVKEVQTWRWQMKEGKERLKATSTTINGTSKMTTHIMHYLVTGRFPHEGMEIDHIDGDVANMKWSNLRELTQEQNRYNRGPSSLRINGIDEGLPQGVSKRSNGRYEVFIGRISLGLFRTKEEAIEVNRKARAKYYGEYRRDANKMRRI